MLTNSSRILVIVASGFLSGCSCPGSGERARPVTALAQIDSFRVALVAYKLDVGEYPTTKAGLGALRSNIDNREGWAGPYLRLDVPLDPWGIPYAYRCCDAKGEAEISAPKQ